MTNNTLTLLAFAHFDADGLPRDTVCTVKNGQITDITSRDSLPKAMACTLRIDLTSLPFAHQVLTETNLTAFVELYQGEKFFNMRIDPIAFFSSLHHSDEYFLTLGSCGNPDFGEDERSPMGDETVVAIDSAAAGRKAALDYISRWSLGCGHWFGGLVFRQGRVVGHYSYNGRFWTGLPFTENNTELTELPR